jgi:hypothetical protein
MLCSFGRARVLTEIIYSFFFNADSILWNLILGYKSLIQVYCSTTLDELASNIVVKQLPWNTLFY